MLHVAPNQEETALISTIERVLEKFGHQLTLTKAHQCDDLQYLLLKQQYNFVSVSTSYTPGELFERINLMAEQMRREKRLVPLIYAVNWVTPFPTLLGTHWGQKVGILHSLSSEAEVTATLQRLGELGEVVDLLAYRSLHSRRRSTDP